MIVDVLSHASLYHVLGPRFIQAFDYLVQTDFSKLAHGRYDVQGDDVFAMVQGYETRPFTLQNKWESHRTYADIQLMLAGEERMGYAQLDQLEICDPYDPARDFAFYLPKSDAWYDLAKVRAGGFMIFLPTDAHLPGQAVDAPTRVEKVVMKVRV